MDMEVKLIIAGAVLFVIDRLNRRFPLKISNKLALRAYKEFVEWINVGWSAVFLAAFLMYSFVQAFEIPSGSMRTTLVEGDRLFVNKFLYGFHVPFSGGRRYLAPRKVKRGDIIVFRAPFEALPADKKAKGVKLDYVKRCVAIAGDTVEIRNKQLIVNGKAVDEPYAKFIDGNIYPELIRGVTRGQYQQYWQSRKLVEVPIMAIRDNFGPVTVPPGCYFGLGDNRDESFDCRFWGPVPDESIKGRPLVVFWPLNRVKIIR